MEARLCHFAQNLASSSVVSHPLGSYRSTAIVSRCCTSISHDEVARLEQVRLQGKERN